MSSTRLAQAVGTTSAQVRKDLSLFGSFGKRGLGYPVTGLRERLRAILGLDRPWTVALIGAGRIGAALFAYGDLARRGFRIVAVLDRAESRVGERWGDVTIEDVDNLEEVIRREGVELVIIAVPATAAQEVVDRAVAAGVRGVLNFAPVRLHTPPGFFVHNVNLVMELEALSFELTRRGLGAGTAGDR